MTDSAAVLDQRPAAGQFVDLKVAGGTMSHDTWQDARNCMYRDDGTPEKRAGFSSEHERFDWGFGGVLLTEAPPTYSVNGLYQFDRVRTTNQESVRSFLVNVDEYLLASAYGDRYRVPLANGLGGSNHYPDFTTAYRDSTRTTICVVMSTFQKFHPSYWTGNVTKWADEDGDYDKWGFLRRIKEIPSGRFSVEHNGRLFVASQDGSTVYYSAPGDPLDFVNGGLFTVDPRFGKVTGFFVTFYGELIIGQESAIQRANFNTSGIIASLTPLTTEIGLVNNRCTAQIGSEIFFLGTKGQVHRLSTTQKFGDFLAASQSARVYKRFNSMPRSSWRAAFMVDDPLHQILWIGHSHGSGTRNDTLTGWDYHHDRFLYAENRSIGGFACGAVMATSRHQQPRAYFGNYATAPADGSSSTSGRIWSLEPTHKEDRYQVGVPVESVDTNDPNHLAPIVTVPRNGGMNVTVAEVAATGTYQDTAVYQASIVIRVLTGGTTGAGSVTLELNDVTEGEIGTILQNVGAAYAGAAFNVEHATYDTGINIQLPVGRALVAGEEIHISCPSGRSVVKLMQTDCPDLQDGLNICNFGGATAFNFVPYLESAGYYFGDPNKGFHLDGITVVTRCVGNKADSVLDDDTSHVNQNQYRYHLDMYFRADKDRGFSQVALLDGNACQNHHLNESKAEAAGRYVDRGNLKYILSSDGTEVSGIPMGRNSDVNVEYVEIDRTVKTFWLRFGQETAASNTHVGVAGSDILESMRVGDFNLVAIHFHVTPVKHSDREIMDEGSTTRPVELQGVT